MPGSYIIIDVYDDKFFDEIDGVTNALDNIKARKPLLSDAAGLVLNNNRRSIHGPAMCVL